MRILLRDLTPGTEYSIQLRADGGDVVSDWSPKFKINTQADIMPPTPPTWVTPETQAWVSDGDTFAAQWNPIDIGTEQNKDFAFYEIEVSATIGGSRIIKTTNTSYVLSFEQNRLFFNTPQSIVRARVRSVDQTGNRSAWTSELTATNPAPSPVTNLVVEPLIDSISVKWTGVDDYDLTHYKVQVSRGTVGGPYSDVYNGPNVSVLHTSQVYNQDHFYRVYAVDKFGSQSSATVSSAVRPRLAFDPDIVAPNVPTALTATIVNNSNGIGSRVNLSWTLAVAPTDLQGFVVRYRRTGDSLWSASTFSYDNRDGFIELQNAHTNYEFQIKAYDFTGNESAWSAAVTASSPNNTAPSAVTGLAGVAGRDSIRYTWNAISDADLKNYELQFSTSSTFASGNYNFVVAGTTMPVSGLEANTNYYARIRSVDVPGLTSAWSATVTVKTLAQITPGDIGAPTTTDLNNLIPKVDASVKSVTTYYYQSNAGTAAPAKPTVLTPASPWTATEPAHADGKQLHETVRTVYTNDTFSYTNVSKSSSYDAAVASSMTYIQTTAPVGRTQDLWIDTTNGKNIPKRWNGSSWVEASDQKAIETAQAAAVNDVKGMWGHPSNTTLIDGGDIYTSSIAASKIMVADWTNMAALNDRDDNLASFGAWSSLVVGGWNRRSVSTGAGAEDFMFNRQVEVSELPFKTGDSILIEFDIKADAACTATAGIWAYGAASGSSSATPVIDITTTSQPVSRVVTVTLDTNGKTSYLIGINGASLVGRLVEVRNVRARRMNGGSLIVDGSIQANKMTAGTFTGGNFVVGTGGAIQSADFVTGVSGWKMGPTGSGLEINAGSIKAFSKIDSRGADLITNGSGALRDNTNFGMYTVDLSDAPTGAAASFDTPVGDVGGRILDEFVPINPARRYGVALQAKQKGSGSAHLYFMAIPHDSYKQQISPQNYMFHPGTTTTLAAPLNNGDTTITLTSAAGWWGNAGKPANTSTHFRSIIWWDYTDPGGKLWPEETYSRSHWAADLWADGGVSGNVITLRAPWAGGNKPAGTKLSNGSSGGSYMYVAASNHIVPTTWTTYTGTLEPGTVTGNTAASGATGWPAAVAYSKFGTLPNRNAAGAVMATSKHSIANITVSDTASVQSLTDSWKFTGTTEINGGAIRTDTIDVVKLKANSIFTQNLGVASTFTVGTASQEGTIQSFDYNPGVNGWRLNKTNGLELNNGIVKADTIRAGKLGGPAGTFSLIELTLGTSLVTNGGYIKSNTNTGTNFNDAVAAGTGWYLGNDGLFVGTGGKIKADTIIGGTIAGQTINLGAGGVINAGAWSISNSGINMPDGAVSISKLDVSTGRNLMPSLVSDFEGDKGMYTNWHGGVPGRYRSDAAVKLFMGNGVVAASDVVSKFNQQSLGVLQSANTEPPTLAFANHEADYNIDVVPGETYIVSGYFWNGGSVDTSLYFSTRMSDGTWHGVSGSGVTLPAGSGPGGAIRAFGTVTVPANVYKMLVVVQSTTLTAGSGWSVDGIKVELRRSGQTTPTPWDTIGTTKIDGSTITTGSIVSNAWGTYTRVLPKYNDAGQVVDYSETITQTFTGDEIDAKKAWRINSNGYAEFNNLNIYGAATLGNPKASLEETFPMTFIGKTNGNEFIQVVRPKDYPFQIQTSDVGAAVKGSGIPAGAYVSGVNTVLQEFTINTNTTTSLAETDISITRPTRTTSTLRSANYSPGQTGWMIRSDGRAEFLDLEAQSVDGRAIKAGTLNADAISAGEISADLTLSGSFETNGYTYFTGNVPGGYNTFYRTDGQFFTLEDIGRQISGPGIPEGTVIIAIWADDVAGLSNLVPVTYTGQRYKMAINRRVVVSSEGINLIDDDGSLAVSLPTDMDKPARFNGSIQATDLTVNNNFRMWGADNILGSGSVLQMASGGFRPTTGPAISFVHDKTVTRTINGTYNLWDDPYVQEPSAFTFDPWSRKFYMKYMFFGTQMLSFSEYGVKEVSYNISSAAEGGADFFADGGMALDKDNFYFLGKINATGQWKFQSIKRANVGAGGLTGGTSARGFSHNWNNSGNMNGRPGFTIYGGNTFVVKHLKDTGKLRIVRYAGIGVNTAPHANVYDSPEVVTGNVASVNIGKFDFDGSNTYIVITMQHGNSEHRKSYVYRATNLAANQWTATGYHFGLPGNSHNAGGTWMLDDAIPAGSNELTIGHDVSAGKFATMMHDGFIAHHTKFGHTTSATKIFASQRWLNSSTGLVSDVSPASSVNITRRARMVLTSPEKIPTFQMGAPNAIRFFFGTVAGTQYRMADLPAGTLASTYTEIPAASVPGSESLMPDAGPSAITAPWGAIQIRGNGYIYGYNMETAALAVQKIVHSWSGSPGYIDLAEERTIKARTNAGVDTGQWLYIQPNGVAQMGEVRTGYQNASYSGFVDLQQAAGSSSGASINAAGKIVRTSSSIRYKEDVQSLDVLSARKVLELEAVTFLLKEESETPAEERVRYPGFIAEQADEIGATNWVVYNNEGLPESFRYAELTAAHNMLIKEHDERVEILEQQNADLLGRLEALEALLLNG